ncbi:MAG: sugar transferase [Algiphilus sp.]|uniref:sugar transferase n=1 Tax=Algiphilus sp. TaxID=1872431 RepID=UPI0032EF186B
MDGSASYDSTGRFLEQGLLEANTRNNYLLSRKKRCLDIVGAASIGLFFSPVIFVVTAILAFQKGPIVFGHERIGYRGKQFCCYKFRSMVPEAEQVLQDLLDNDAEARLEWDKDFKLKKDPRVTRVGAFLRKTSLDELPQLWNVLKGDMSLVGPRPIVREELLRYGRGARFYMSTCPGLTGLWQVSGRNDISYARRIAMDRAYAENATLGVDIRLILRTVLVVIGMKGSY